MQGFTLVEVLVALVVMSVMAGLAWRGIDGIVRSRSVTDAQMESTLRVNTVLAQWAQDLQSIYDTPAVPALAFDGATVRMVRQADEGVQLVAWSLRGNTWMRWASPVATRQGELQDHWLRSQQLLGNEETQLRTLEGVIRVQVYFYRRDGWSNAQSSGDVVLRPRAPAPPPPASGAASGVPAPPPVTTQVELPGGVRLVLEFAPTPTSPLAGVLTRDVALAPQQQQL